MSDLPVLWQYSFSHYNEKARWALDHKRIAHRRRSLLPGGPRAMWFASRGTLPVLDIDGERIADSSAIIDALEARAPDRPVYPEDDDQRRRALELEEFFDEEMGHDLRRVAFHDWSNEYLADLLTTAQPGAVRAPFCATLPIGMAWARDPPTPRGWEFRERVAERPALDWVREMYRRHRPSSSAVSG